LSKAKQQPWNSVHTRQYGAETVRPKKGRLSKDWGGWSGNREAAPTALSLRRKPESTGAAGCLAGACTCWRRPFHRIGARGFRLSPEGWRRMRDPCADGFPESRRYCSKNSACIFDNESLNASYALNLIHERQPVRPEPVEGQALTRRRSEGFDKLSPNGGWYAEISKDPYQAGTEARNCWAPEPFGLRYRRPNPTGSDARTPCGSFTLRCLRANGIGIVRWVNSLRISQ
jgi:hypothetical protein